MIIGKRCTLREEKGEFGWLRRSVYDEDMVALVDVPTWRGASEVYFSLRVHHHGGSF